MVIRGMAVLAVALALVAPGCGGGEVPVVSGQEGGTSVTTEGGTTEGSTTEGGNTGGGNTGGGNTKGGNTGGGTGGNPTTTEPSD